MHVRQILLADEHQGWNPDLAEALGEVGDEQLLLGAVAEGNLQLERAALHLADPRAYLRVDLVRAAPRPVDPHAEVDLDRRVEVAGLQRGFLFSPAGDRLLRPVVTGEDRGDEDEGANEVRARGPDLEDNPP